MKKISVIFSLTLFFFMFISCVPSSAKPSDYKSAELLQLSEPKENQEMAILHTNLGDIKFVLYEDLAPNTVKHFKKLVNEGFYNNRDFYGIQLSDNAIFSGAVSEDGKKAKITTDNKKPIDVEFSSSLWHFSGAVSAYGDEVGFLDKKIVSDSRFFIMGYKEVDYDLLRSMEEYGYPTQVINAYKLMGGNPTLTGKYTVFGQVIEGLEIINTVIDSGYKKGNGHNLIRPNMDIIIKEAEIAKYSSELNK